MDTADKDREGGALQAAVSFPAEFRPLNAPDAADAAAEVAAHRTCDRLGIPAPGSDLPQDLTSLRDYQDASPLTMKIWMAIERKLDTIIRLTGEAAHRLPHAEPGVIKSLAGGACTLRSKKVLQKGEFVQIRLSPPAYPPFTVDVVGRIDSVAEAGEWDLEYGITFTALHHDDAEFLITYIFNRQREIMRGRQNSGSA